MEHELTINLTRILEIYKNIFAGYIIYSDNRKVMGYNFNEKFINNKLEELLEIKEDVFFVLIELFGLEDREKFNLFLDFDNINDNNNEKNVNNTTFNIFWRNTLIPKHPLYDKFPKTFIIREKNQIQNQNFRVYDISKTILDNNSRCLLFADETRNFALENAWFEDHDLILKFFDSNPYGISIYNNNGNFLMGNEAHLKLHGSLPPKDYSIFNDPIGSEAHFFQEYYKALMNGKVYHAPEMWYDAQFVSDGLPSKLHCQRTVAIPLIYKNPDKNIFIHMHEDITRQKIAELNLNRLKKELESRIKQRTISLEKSEKKYRIAYKRANCFKGLFTHDVFNMFNSIGNALEYAEILIRNNSDVEKVLDYFELINTQIIRGKNLIKNIKKLSEIEKSEMTIIPIDLLNTIEKAIEFVKSVFHNKELSISTTNLKEFEKINVLANNLILDVFENILINAVRHNNERDINVEISFEVILEKDEKFGLIRFADNGKGIPDSRKKEIFSLEKNNDNNSDLSNNEYNKKVFRIEKNYNNSKDTSNLGMGLSNVSQLISLCNGKIWVEDRINGEYQKGALFVVQLKIAK